MFAWLERLSPTNWPIKYRLITAGIALSCLALGTLVFLRVRLSELSATYNETSMNWEVLARINRISQLLSDSESKLRAFATSGNQDWLRTIAKNTETMDALLPTLTQTAHKQPKRLSVIEQIRATYDKWTREIVMRYAESPVPSDLESFARTLMSEPLAIKLHSQLNELAKEIHANNVVANKAVLSASESALLIVTYEGVLFFIGFATLMLSLWFTLIPDLDLLLESARELKKGNLAYRLHLHGRSETARLGRAFNEMAASLEAQNEKLKELNRLKSDFVSTVSHELRTPLTAIKGSIGLILGGVTGGLPTETADMLRITQKNTDRLIRLINEVLDIAKIEAGKIQMHFDKYSLVDVLDNVILGVASFAQTQGIQLLWSRPEVSPLVVIDRDRIEQVMTNLLSNAIKFTNPGGTIMVSAHWDSDEGKSSEVIIEVQDTGQGIPEEFAERIFEKFQQAEGSGNKTKEGTGLGLAITKALIEEHGGRIWVVSQVGKGSTFSFSLPWNGTEFADVKKSIAA
jgi:signal transduction histidine kinase